MQDWNISLEKKDFENIEGTQASLYVVRISGSLDAFSFPKLQETLHNLYDGGARHIILNMARLKYIASAGLGVLIRFSQELRHHGGDLKLSHVPPHIQEILKLVSFDTVLEEYSSDKKAALSFK